MNANSKTSISELYNRYVWLAETVYNAGKITFEDIAKRWRKSSINQDRSELSLRTFHNHRKAVAELFGVYVECDKHDGWKYYIENDHAIGGDSIKRWMLSTLSVNNLAKGSDDIKDKIILEEIPSGMSYLTQIIEAMREKTAILVRHFSFRRKVEYDIVIEPYCVKLFQQRWYVVGKNRDEGRVMLYALDRFLDCKTLDESFDVPENFDGKTFFSEYFGVYVDEQVPMQRVLIKADGTEVKYLRTLPLHSSQKEVETTEEYATFEYMLRPTPDFVSEIVRRSAHAKVLEPEWIAEKVVSTLKEMLAKASEP